MNLKEIKEKISKLERDMDNIIACAESVESALLFAKERTDKNVTQTCALCVEVIIKLLDDHQDEIIEVGVALEKLPGNMK